MEKASQRTTNGRLAELAVADFVVARGFAILHRNLRLGPLELDLVCREGPVVAIVEVRTRGPRSFARALDSVTPAKQARLRRASTQLWERIKNDESIERIRFDVASVRFTSDGSTHVEYVQAAF
jgi:putative endonuclease